MCRPLWHDVSTMQRRTDTAVECRHALSRKEPARHLTQNTLYTYTAFQKDLMLVCNKITGQFINTSRRSWLESTGQSWKRQRHRQRTWRCRSSQRRTCWQSWTPLSRWTSCLRKLCCGFYREVHGQRFDNDQPRMYTSNLDITCKPAALLMSAWSRRCRRRCGWW